jgi:hypothetical protein
VVGIRDTEWAHQEPGRTGGRPPAFHGLVWMTRLLSQEPAYRDCVEDSKGRSSMLQYPTAPFTFRRGS